MFVQSEQGWIWCRLNGQMVESVVLLATMCQFLCMMAVSCWSMLFQFPWKYPGFGVYACP